MPPSAGMGCPGRPASGTRCLTATPALIGGRPRPGVPPMCRRALRVAVGGRRPAVPRGPTPRVIWPLRSRSPRRNKRGSGLRTLTFKFRVSPDERRVIRERARGYPSPAEYARRTLVAGWALPVGRIARVTEAFVPIQEMIEAARAAGLGGESDAATDALRDILAAITER